MLTFETVNELTLKVTCQGSDVLFTKAGSFIAGESANGKNSKLWAIPPPLPPNV